MAFLRSISVIHFLLSLLIHSECKRPDGNARPSISCDGADDLEIRWPTNRAFTADVVSVPASVSQALRNKIQHMGVTLDIVVFGANPP